MLNMGSIIGSGRSPGEGTGYPLQYSFLVCSFKIKAKVLTVAYKSTGLLLLLLLFSPPFNPLQSRRSFSSFLGTVPF